MKITDKLITEVHKQVNNKLQQEYTLFDMSDLSKHPEGSLKTWQIKYILEAYNEVR